jgi:hypothetical protein
MENNQLEALKRIGYTESNGLVICNDNPQTAHIAEWYHIADKAKRLGVSAVLFRRYCDNSNTIINSKPSVYVFEEEKAFEKQTPTQLHAKLWSAGEIDVYIILGRTTIDIFNARKPAEDELSREQLNSFGATIAEFNDYRFSAHIFGKGMFWEQGIWELDEKQTPFELIVEQLEKTRTAIQGQYTDAAQQKALDKMLLLSILIMFLQEKKDKNNDYALKKIFEDYQVNSFIEILRKDNNGTQCIEFFKKLQNKYNGKIFDILSKEEEEFISKENLALIAQFVEGKEDAESKLLSIWRAYNFDFIPVELISSVYENFLQSEAKNQNKEKEKGVVYTPPFLVNFLIDEVMPLDLDWNKQEKSYLKNGKIAYKILDPSCGSGVFLVAAYKRLLDWWVINNSTKLNSSSSSEISDTFKQILEDNIFGVDINPTATQISIFSLTIAFLDKIDPKLLWGNFQFKNLSANNIKDKNFFEWASTAPKDFDLVIGNPPFNVPTSHEKKVKAYISEYVTYFQQKIDFQYTAQVPDNLAFHFLEFAKVLSPEKRVCLIIPTTLLLYSPQSTSIKYRKSLLEKTNVEKIYDFTHLRRILFKRTGNNNNKRKKTDETDGAEPPVCALIVNNSAPQFKTIEHIVAKRLVSTEKKLRFEIDHYDRHKVQFDWACRYSFVWKCNLLGGGRLFHLIYRLSLLQNLNDFIENKNEKYKNEIQKKVQEYKPTWVKEVSELKVEDKPLNEKEKKKELNKRRQEFVDAQNQWIFQTGYMAGKRTNFAPHITNKTIISDILSSGEIVEDVEKETYIEGDRSIWLFTPPFIAIKQVINEKSFLLHLSNEYRPFKKGITGIHAPQEDFKTLQEIYNRLKKYEETYMLWLLTNSSSALIAQETSVHKTDLETLPFPNFTEEEEEYLVLSPTEIILRDDVLNHYKHLGKSVTYPNDGYEPLERKLSASNKEDNEVLKKFGEVFCKHLNEIYAKNGKSWQRGKIYQTKSGDKLSEGFIIYQLGFGVTTSEPERIEIDEDYLKSLIFDTESNRGAIWVRVGRVYQHTPNGYDCVFLIKPANIRYWLGSVALRDAGEVFMDLKQAGL